MLTGSNLLHTKQYNLRIVHEVIRRHGPLSRSDIARRTELTVQTVSNLVKELIGFGLIYEAERRQEGRGAPSVALALNPDGAFSIGLDLDRDHLSGVLVDLTGAMRQSLRVELDHPSPEETLDLMQGMVERLIEAQGLTCDHVCGVGIGVPGPMHRTEDGTGYLVSPRAFPDWRDVPLAELLNERLGMPVVLENNATAAAIGERWYGTGQQFRNFFYLYFGSGLGGGLIVNGQRFEGYSGNAGEVGYLPLPDEDGETPDGHYLGLHFNLSRLYARLREGGADAHTPDDLDQLMADRHPELLAWIERAAETLAPVLLAVEYLIDPEAVFFGGRLPDRVLSELIDRVSARLPAQRIRDKRRGPALLLATAGVEAASLGVATLPIYQFFAPALEVLLKSGKGREAPALNTRLAAAS